LGLSWNHAAEEYVHASNRPGTGFTTNRVARDQPKRWRERLTPIEVREIRRVLESFPLRGWERDMNPDPPRPTQRHPSQ
jgi:hypothetical protein